MTTFSSSKNQRTLDIFLAILQRCLVIFFLIQVSQTIDLNNIVGLRDGGGYMSLVSGFLKGTFAAVPREDTQYFIGYPFFLSFFLRFLAPWVGVYLFQFLCVAGTLLLGARLFQNPWITRWLVFCIPSYVLFTSVNMSESLTLFLIFLIFDCYQNKRTFFCAIAFGAAMITRPQSILILYVLMLADLFKNRLYKNLISMLFVPGICFLGMHVFNQLAFGDFFHNYRLYGAHEASKSFFSFPLTGYFTFSADATIRLTNRIYIWLFTGFITGGLFLLWRRFKLKALNPLETLFLTWGTLQFLFFLSINSRWGFMELPRYFIPILPSVFLGYGHRLPQKWPWVALGAVLSIVFAVYAEASGNRYAH